MFLLDRKFVLYAIIGFLLLARSVSSKKQTATTTTFELYDNGASNGGINITLSANDFPDNCDSGDDKDEHLIHCGELFAHDMSYKINITHYGKEPGSVRSTRAFREDGERIVRFEQLLPARGNGDGEGDNGGGQQQLRRRVYLVAEGLDFIWPFIQYGHQQIISSKVIPSLIQDDESHQDQPVIIESVSESPRVFKIYNFFTMEESQALIDNALSLKGIKALKRSTVGNQKGADNEGASIDSGRTSENAWDSESPKAKIMITRSFNLTNIEEDAGKVDGLQIVRYFPGNFYNTHPDYFGKDADPDFDFNPYSGGSNRFATVFMYISDPEEGGATVFPRVASPNPTEPSQDAIDMFRKGSLEYNLLFECNRKLAVPPNQGTAALFYSVTPDGRIDPMAHHGACPVIKGVKWGANIWIWNRQRFGEIKTGDSRKLKMINAMNEPVFITWEGKANGVMQPGASIEFNTYEYHRFKAHQGSHKGETLGEFTVQSKPDEQEWNIKPARRLLDDDGGIEDIPSRSGGGSGGAHSEL